MKDTPTKEKERERESKQAKAKEKDAKARKQISAQAIAWAEDCFVSRAHGHKGCSAILPAEMRNLVQDGTYKYYESQPKAKV